MGPGTALTGCRKASSTRRFPHIPLALLENSGMGRILIIDDERKLRELMARVVQLEGYEVHEAGDGRTGLKRLEQGDIDVVLCDVKLPDANGVELVQKIKSAHPEVEVILLTAYGNIPDGVQAIKNGAFDYLTKGDDNHRIVPLIARALEKAELARRIQQLQGQLDKRYSFGSIIGSSKALMTAVDLARKVAPTDASVLLTGETGTGKEVFAQAIHHGSGRSGKPFVAINCAAISRELLESELFGHRAGAFTGATKDSKGLLAEAHRGSIFLDEIGEMGMDLQTKLLRVLETGEFLRVGESKPTQVDVRVIAATNRDLLREIEAGHFRSDLYYRLSVFQIPLPALRERVGDIAALAQEFAVRMGAKVGKKVRGCTAAYLSALERHKFPGNVRELKNIIERSAILSEGDLLDIDSLPADLQPSAAAAGTWGEYSLASAEKAQIIKVLRHTNGNKTESAKLLQIALTTLYRKIEEYGIEG